MKYIKNSLFLDLLFSLFLLINCGEYDNSISDDNINNNPSLIFDEDNDGVADTDDACTDTPEGETADSIGCSDSQKDPDGDGVTDDLDICAATPEGVAVDSEGCSNSQKATISGYDFNFLNVSAPPYGGTIFITGDIITSQDTSVFDSISYIGTDLRTMFDRRNGGDWTTIEPHIFPATFFDGPSIEIQINPEFTLEEAQIEARKYGFLVGQLALSLRKDVETMWIHKGVEGYGGGNNNILIHTGMTASYEQHETGNITEETLIHEAAHTSIDVYCYNDSDWFVAVENDE